MTSSDGFCSSLSFAPGELGTVYAGTVPSASHPHHPMTIGISNSVQGSPVPTPTGPAPSAMQRIPSSVSTSFASPVPLAAAASPIKSRSNSVSSITTQASHAHNASKMANSPTPTMGTVPSVTAPNPSGALPLSTPPMTPGASSGKSEVHVLGKRDSAGGAEGAEDEQKAKKRRIAPTPVTGPGGT